jgi:hypothetical protein
MDNAKHDTGEVVKLSPLNYIKSNVFIVANNNTMYLRQLAHFYCLNCTEIQVKTFNLLKAVFYDNSVRHNVNV